MSPKTGMLPTLDRSQLLAARLSTGLAGMQAGRAPRRVRTRVVRLVCLLLCVLCSGSVARHALGYEDLESLLNVDPQLDIMPLKNAFDYALMDLWIEALGAPEADVRRRAAESFVRASREGFKGFDKAIPHLNKLLETPDPHPQVRLAAARALSALGARNSARLLQQELDRGGLNAAQMIEPTLANWKFEPMYPRWRQRLTTPATSRRYLLLAIDSLGVVRDTGSAELMRTRVTDTEQPIDVRLAAARSLAHIQPSGLVDLAQQFAAGESAGVLERTLAAELLAHHQDLPAIELLVRLAADPEPAVADRALTRLFAIAPERIVPAADRLLASADSNLRRWAVHAVALEPNAVHLSMLQQRLIDPHPQIRVLARDALLRFATEAGLKDEVIEAVQPTIADNDWRGLEQAGRILVLLDHKPTATRLVELLDHPRDEVGVMAAWGVRRLSVSETLEPALAYCERGYKQLRPDPNVPASATEELRGNVPERMNQLIQHFGVLRFTKAEPLMRQLVPKQPMPIEPRAAAAWSLAYLYEGQAPEDLTTMFAQRVADSASTPPEHTYVRRLTAVGLGRMKSESAVPVLRQYIGPQGAGEVRAACAWAIEQLTGEKVPPGEPVLRYPQGWFLMDYKE